MGFFDLKQSLRTFEAESSPKNIYKLILTKGKFIYSVTYILDCYRYTIFTVQNK